MKIIAETNPDNIVKVIITYNMSFASFDGSFSYIDFAREKYASRTETLTKEIGACNMRNESE